MKKNLLSVITISLLFVSCVSSYKTINSENQEFSHRIETENLTIEYNPEIFKFTKNNKFQKRVDNKDIGFAFAKFSNNSNDTLNISKDIIFKSKNGNSNILSKEELYKEIKFQPWTYYLALISAGFTVRSDGFNSASIGINPLGLIYSVPSSIIASNANKKMRKEFERYDFFTTNIYPNESKFVLLNFENKDKTGWLSVESIKGEKVNAEPIISHNKSFIIDNCIKYDKQKHSTFEMYQEEFIKTLNESKLMTRVVVFERKYRNDQIKTIGTNAKHKLGRNTSYLYKVGTWINYYKNGKIKEYVDYDMEGRKDGVYKFFNEEGEMKIKSKFDKGVLIE